MRDRSDEEVPRRQSYMLTKALLTCFQAWFEQVLGRHSDHLRTGLRLFVNTTIREYQSTWVRHARYTRHHSIQRRCAPYHARMLSNPCKCYLNDPPTSSDRHSMA